MQKQSTFRKYAVLVSLGIMGGTIYTTSYLRFAFYTQLIDSLRMTNVQLGLVSTITNAISFIIAIPGSFLADKLEAKRVILFSCGSISLLALLFPLYVHGYPSYVFFQCANTLVMGAYWGCLMKYINNLGDEEEAGNSFGTYYLINGLSGALGNFIPLWAQAQFGDESGVNVAVVSMGIVTTVATVLVLIFLEDEKQLAARGIYLKGDEPIQIKHIVTVLKWPGTWMLILAYTSTIVLYENMSYMAPFLTNVVGIDENLSSTLAIVRQYCTLVLSPLGGYMCDKVLKATYKWYIMAFAIVAVLYVGLGLFFGPNSNPIIAGIYSVLPAGVSMALYGVTYSIIRECHIPAMVTGTASGLTAIGGAIQGMILPPIFGTCLDNYGDAAHGFAGYSYVFYIIAGVCVLGILNAMWVGSHHKKCLAGKRKMDLSGIEN